MRDLGVSKRPRMARLPKNPRSTVAAAAASGHVLRQVGGEEEGAQRVPAGKGLEVVRRGTRRGHTYHLLAAQRGPRKSFEPFLVTLTDKSEVFPGFQHPGSEFIYILAGS